MPALDLGTVFAAIANADRLAILATMRERRGASACPMTVTEVAHATDLSRFSASRHLRILCDAGLVDVTRRGQALLHELRSDGFDAIEDWLYPFIDDTERATTELPGLPLLAFPTDAATRAAATPTEAPQ